MDINIWTLTSGPISACFDEPLRSLTVGLSHLEEWEGEGNDLDAKGTSMAAEASNRGIL